MNAAPRSQKKRWFQHLARAYVKRRLKRQFSNVTVLGAKILASTLASGPAIIACNHVAWWDPLLLVQLDAFLKSDAYCLMDEINLRELSFFGDLGALPLNRNKRTQSYRDLLQSLEIVKKPGQLLFIFPQGRQTPAHFPLHFFEGAAFLAARSGLPVFPLGLRYDFAEGPRQVVHLAVGAPLHFEPQVTQAPATRATFTRRLEDAVQAQLERIDAHLFAPETDSHSLLERAAGHDRRERIPLLAAALRPSTKGNH
jgi:1-acyl-sn-glycerol-3-phosphate acyltransferase